MNLLSSFLNHLASMPLAGEPIGTEKPPVPGLGAKFASLIAAQPGRETGASTLVEPGFVQPGDAGNGLPVGGHALPSLPDPVVESPLSSDELPLRGGNTASDRFVLEDRSPASRITRRVRIDAFGAPVVRRDAPAEISAAPVTGADRVPEGVAAQGTRLSGPSAEDITIPSHGDAQKPLQGPVVSATRDERSGIAAEIPGARSRGPLAALVSENPVTEPRPVAGTEARAPSMAIDEFPAQGRVGVMPGDFQAPAAAAAPEARSALSVAAALPEVKPERDSGAPTLLRRRIDLRTAVRDLSGGEGGAHVRRDYADMTRAPGLLPRAEQGARDFTEGRQAAIGEAPETGPAHERGLRRIDAGALSALRVSRPPGEPAPVLADEPARSEAVRTESARSGTLRPQSEAVTAQGASVLTTPISEPTGTPARGSLEPVMEQATRNAPGGQGRPLSGSVSAGTVTIPDSGTERQTPGVTAENFADPDALAADTASKVRTSSPKLPDESVRPGTPAPVPDAKPNEPVVMRKPSDRQAGPDPAAKMPDKRAGIEAPPRVTAAEPAPVSQGAAREKTASEANNAARGGTINHAGPAADADARQTRASRFVNAPLEPGRTTVADAGTARQVAQHERVTSAAHDDAVGTERFVPSVSRAEADSPVPAGSEAGRRSHELVTHHASGFTTEKGSVLTGVRLVAGEPQLTRLPASETVASYSLQPAPGTERWADALGNRVMLMLRTEQGFARLTLNPEQLGPMEVRLKVQDDQAQLWLNAQHPQAREALETALPRLREMLAEQGLDLMRQNSGEQQARGQGSRAYERTIDQPAGHEQAAQSEEQGRRPGGKHDGLIDHYA